MEALPAALVLSLPLVVAGKALIERRRALATRRWPTTVAELTPSGETYSYIVRGETHCLEIHTTPDHHEGTPAPSVRVHYDPEQPQSAVFSEGPLPPLAEPIGIALAVAALLLAIVRWLA